MQARWFTLKSKQKGAKSKGSDISGEVQLQFAITDPANPSASAQDIFERFMAFVTMASVTPGAEDDEYTEGFNQADRELGDDEDEDDDDDDKDLETSDETDDPLKPGATEKEKRKRKLRLAKLKKKTKARAYEFTGGSDIVGIVFLDISKITDLPPERNRKYQIRI